MCCSIRGGCLRGELREFSRTRRRGTESTKSVGNGVRPVDNFVWLRLNHGVAVGFTPPVSDSLPRNPEILRLVLGGGGGRGHGGYEHTRCPPGYPAVSRLLHIGKCEGNEAVWLPGSTSEPGATLRGLGCSHSEPRSRPELQVKKKTSLAANPEYPHPVGRVHNVQYLGSRQYCYTRVYMRLQSQRRRLMIRGPGIVSREVWSTDGCGQHLSTNLTSISHVLRHAGVRRPNTIKT